MQRKENDMSEEKMLEQATADIEKRIKTALIDQGMTQVQLADLLNLSPQWVNRAIKGQNTPKAINIRKKIYKVLGLDD